jgi:type IV secretion system protein TrbL
VLGNVISSGIKVLVLAVIIGIGSTLFSQFTAGFGGATPSIDQAMAIVLAALSLLGLGIFGPGIANSLVSGGPQLGAGAAIGTGLAAGGMVAAGGAAIGAVASGGAAAAARGGAVLAGGASTAYSLGAAGQSGASGFACGLGGVANAGAQAAISPLKRAASRAADSLKSSYQAGSRAAFETTGGSSTGGTVGGDAAAALASPSPADNSASGGPPAWAQRMKRSQAMTHGVQAAAHAVRSGDSHGGGSSVNLSESD